MLNIVIPMAGRGSRFVNAGYAKPKPFIDVFGRCMIEWVVHNLTPYEPYNFIFIARREHEKYIKEKMSFATNVIYVDEVTEGAACTVLLAEDIIDNEDGLLIANSDQLVGWNNGDEVRTNGFHYWKESDNVQDMINYAGNDDACIAIFPSTHPKWSYAKLGEDGYVEEVAEKKVISNNATVGCYYFKRGRDFVTAAHSMIKKDIRVNGEFYVCPIFNELVDDHSVSVYEIHEMHGLGTPEDLEKFKKDFKGIRIQ